MRRHRASLVAAAIALAALGPAAVHAQCTSRTQARDVSRSANKRARCYHKVLRSGPSADCGTLRSEEHTSELQSLTNLVCRLLLEKKKNQEKHTQSQLQPQ